MGTRARSPRRSAKRSSTRACTRSSATPDTAPRPSWLRTTMASSSPRRSTPAAFRDRRRAAIHALQLAQALDHAAHRGEGGRRHGHDPRLRVHQLDRCAGIRAGVRALSRKRNGQTIERGVRMTWGPIVVGVDASPEAVGAAKLGYRIARAAGENCDLVHATPDAWAPFSAVGDPKQVRETQQLQVAVARHRVTEALRSDVAPELLEGLDVRLGPAAVVLQQGAHERSAGLRVLTVFEPLPVLPDVPPIDPTSYYGLSQDLLQREIWPLIRIRDSEKLVRHGMVVETLLREATEWSADVLVVGSHGKGWAQRVLLGSVTERLLNDLPTSLLVVPVAARVPAEQPEVAAARMLGAAVTA